MIGPETVIAAMMTDAAMTDMMTDAGMTAMMTGAMRTGAVAMMTEAAMMTGAMKIGEVMTGVMTGVMTDVMRGVMIGMMIARKIGQGLIAGTEVPGVVVVCKRLRIPAQSNAKNERDVRSLGDVGVLARKHSSSNHASVESAPPKRLAYKTILTQTFP